ncbi:ABCB family ABC transporter ATP-binding protein/permease [Iodobacter fluviatilis]|uniref:ATP-binding cassette subfamily B protein n=1 Tax=Iodobacter fluviatilis TaxID=537 RepID=A0A377Q8Z4_9NEIS|nr:ABC transporter ATP-binding protein/permease [Iodobacter fluviatilis]TCU88642.1 ATP-binding cassette subfamily B protein [Iodobacter fluviatilis]STQ91287.1 Putative multidrug export ATP-binding/permease protein SAV1866 [Iodobacter fluviatilis]
MSPTRRNDWQTLSTLLPYLWQYKNRVILALSLLILAKFANVSVPLVLKSIVDGLDPKHGPLVLPLSLVLGYGALRLCASVFGEMRDAVFAKVTQGAIRKVAMQVFEHLHRLSLRFHLERQTGGMSRDIDRGTKGISFLLNFTLFNILPTLVEILLVAGILLKKYDVWFSVITFGTIVLYIVFTLGITEWRMSFRRTMNDMDSKANTRAVDSLLNYETVKYFNNERWEAERYDTSLKIWETAAVKNQVSLSFLNAGQAIIIAFGVTLLVWLAADGVVKGTMTLGDLVLVNAFLLQLYAPLNFLGFVYREIKHSLADMEKMFTLMGQNAEVTDIQDAQLLATTSAAIRFDQVDFSYEANRKILHAVSFDIPAGKTVAVVGSSGAGKSTLSRLLYRFYDVSQGSISINGVDLRQLNQVSLRAHIGIVPQDTVLFNDSIYYNIAYGQPSASRDEVIQAAKSAHIYDFILSLPEGFDTLVGERGLKLSGGEKQRVAIARTILKNPPILIFDEATSALDSRTEKAIQAELKEISANRTTLIVAHRLSTVADADEILVMEQGVIIERGRHRDLLDLGAHYAHMWQLQQGDEENK